MLWSMAVAHDQRALTAHRTATEWDVSAHSAGASGSMASNMQTNDASSAVAESKPRLNTLLRRWPTALGIGVAALTLSDFDDGREFAIVLLIASIGYLVIAVLERPRATWWVLAGLLVAVVCLRLLEIPPEPVFAVLAVGVIIFGLVRGSLRRPWLPAFKHRPPSCSEPSLSLPSLPAPSSAALWLQSACWRTLFGVSFTFVPPRLSRLRWRSGVQSWIP
jgi:hypothetical protein